MRKESIISAMSLPKDLLLGAILIHITGQYEVCIENYKGIIDYTNELIRIQAKTCQVLIQGSRLKIEYYTNEEMKISGKIEKIEYDNQER